MAIKINIETIPHSQQRYETVGDWWWGADGTWEFRVSNMGNWRFEMLVAIHELAECAMCRFWGISQVDVDDFDKVFEANRVEGNTDEPGDDPKAPYRNYHCIATGIERVMATMLGVSWKEYESAINAL